MWEETKEGTPPNYLFLGYYCTQQQAVQVREENSPHSLKAANTAARLTGKKQVHLLDYKNRKKQCWLVAPTAAEAARDYFWLHP